MKIVVFNNSSLNFVELEMKAAGIVDFGTGLENPSFAAVAESVGITGIRVEKASELRDALSRALATDGPVLVDVVTAREELSMPPTITAAQMKGFSVWALKTILSGRGDECSTSPTRTSGAACSSDARPVIECRRRRPPR